MSVMRESEMSGRLLISGAGSGSGKTTVTLAALCALSARGVKTTAFKCGPDYVDPMYHRKIVGDSSYNIDPFFLKGDALRAHMLDYGRGVCVCEGAMGYYDGLGSTAEASAYTVARETKTPVVLVVNAKGIGASLGAIIGGFVGYRPDNMIAGVIMNNANSDREGGFERISREAGVKYFGRLPRRPDWLFPKKQYGLTPPDEIDMFFEKQASIAASAENFIDIDGMTELAKKAPDLGEAFASADMPRSAGRARRVSLAVARDDVFCFIYQENIEILRELGCEITWFSPSRDERLPKNADCLYLPGGYQTARAYELSKNASMKKSVREFIDGGGPTIAECGAMTYLSESIDGIAMCGAIPGRIKTTDRLSGFGYVTMTATRDNLLCDAGESVASREFRYWSSDFAGDGFVAKKASAFWAGDDAVPCAHTTRVLYAGSTSLYFPAYPKLAANFVRKAAEYGRGI